jgi:hypothetical protein
MSALQRLLRFLSAPRLTLVSKYRPKLRGLRADNQFIKKASSEENLTMLCKELMNANLEVSLQPGKAGCDRPQEEGAQVEPR